MKNWKNVFDSFLGLKVLVIGDVMIDAYILGKVERISPEAPVPVVAVTGRENRLGGAANVALNLQALGANPILCSVIGNRRKGDLFLELLDENKLSKDGIIQAESRITTVKTRVIGNNTQMLRIDEEVTAAISKELEQELLERIYSLMKGAAVIVLEDYDKGVLTPFIIANVISKARELHIPVAVDPKKKNFKAFKGATLFKPNLKELKEGAGVEVSTEDMDGLKEAIRQLHEQMQLDYLMVTLSEAGVLIYNGTEFQHQPAHVRNIADVSGAGDTVVSVAALGLAVQLAPAQLAALSNLAGGLVCEEVGVVPVERNKLLEEAEMLLEAPSPISGASAQ